MYATRCSPELAQVSQLLHLSLMLLVVRSPELVQVVHLNWFRWASRCTSHLCYSLFVHLN